MLVSSKHNVHAIAVEEFFQSKEVVFGPSIGNRESSANPIVGISAMLRVVRVRTIHWPMTECNYPWVFFSVFWLVRFLKLSKS